MQLFFIWLIKPIFIRLSTKSLSILLKHHRCHKIKNGY